MSNAEKAQGLPEQTGRFIPRCLTPGIGFNDQVAEIVGSRDGVNEDIDLYLWGFLGPKRIKELPGEITALENLEAELARQALHIVR